MATINIKGVGLSDAVQTTVDNYNVATTSDLVNDSNFAVSTGTIAHATNTKSAVQLSGTSGVKGGTYGPSANVTVSGTTKKSITIPQITINAQGRITAVTNRTLSVQTY